MTALKKLLVVLAASLPLAAWAQPAPEPAPAAPPPPAPAKPAEPPKPAPAKPAVTLYGTFNVNVQIAEAPNATNRAASLDDRLAVSIDSTNIGVRAAADVAYGLGVVAQCEIAATVDEGAGGVCSRNSRIGVTSPAGTLFFGRWDTPFKALWYGGKADDPFGNTDVYGAANIMGSPGFKTRSGDVHGFDQRAVNSIVYHSPKFMGASVRLQHQVNEGANAADTVSPRLWAAAVNYDFGPFSVGAAYERHDDFAGLDVIGATTTAVPGTLGNTVRNPAQGATGSHNAVDQAWRVAAGYELATPFGTTAISAAVEQIMYEQENATAGQLKDFDRFAYQVGLKHRVGDHEFRARYNLADSPSCTTVGGACRTSGFGAQNLTLGYAHHLSKAAQVYAFWTQIMNERNATYTFGVAGPTTNLAGSTTATFFNSVAPGADPWGAGVGMRYAF